jgi:hypothetical protein
MLKLVTRLLITRGAKPMSKQGETIHKQLEEILQDMPVQKRLDRLLFKIEQWLAHSDEAQNLNHVNFITEIKYTLEDITNKGE